MDAFRPLSALDASFIEIESPTTPMHIGSLSRFEGGPLRDPSGAIRMDAIRELVNERIALVPRFRQRIMGVPFGAGRPVWVDDGDFDVTYHVNLTTLPSPGSPEQLRHLTEHLHMQLLDRSRPLWELWVVDGLADGTVGLIEKIHHALVDGVSSVDVAMTLFDTSPDHTVAQPVPWTARRAPGPVSLLSRSLLVQATDPLKTLTSAVRRLGHPRASRARIERLLRAGQTLASRQTLAPAASINRPVGRTRRFEAVRQSMGDIDETRAGLGGTLNDIVLAAVAGGLRYLMQARGDGAPETALNVLVPVSLRTGDEHLLLGNRVGAMIVPLPTQEPDPVRRLRAVCAATSERKARHQADAVAALMSGAEHLPEPLVGAVGRLVHHQPFVNVVVTNVPGPPCPLFLLGARLLDSLPIVPLGGNLDVSVGVLSYDGQLTLGLLADAATCPDVAVLAEGIDKAFAELRYAAEPTGTEGTS